MSDFKCDFSDVQGHHKIQMSNCLFTVVAQFVHQIKKIDQRMHWVLEAEFTNNEPVKTSGAFSE